MDGAALSAEIAQAKLKYTLQDASVADYSHTGWKHIAEKSVDEEDQATPPPSPPIRQPNQVATGQRLSILGTGSAAPSKLRASTSIYLSLSRYPVNGSLPGMLIDCGEGAFGQLERQFDSDSRALASCIAGLKCIWISHHHADHQCGLLRVLDEYLRVTSNGPAVLFVVAPHSVLEYVKAWLPDLPARIRLLTCAEMNDNPPNFQTQMSNWIGSMRSVRVWHCHDAYGLVLRLHDGSKLVYSGDTKPCDQLIRAGMDASLLIHEATFDDSMEEDADKKKHTTVGQAIDVARRMRAARLVLTHFSQRYPALPPPMSSTTSGSSTLSAPEIFCAYDGFTIAL
jgi:ribonuclease Z